jgi:hypothetical protein
LDQLDRARQAFDPGLIQELTRLDDRMRAADSVLSTHIAPTIFFRTLEKLTLQTVAFNNFNFQGGDAQNMTIAMEGVAQSVNSIALQAQYLSESGILTNPIFSNIDRRADGVNFNLTAAVNPTLLKYSQLIIGSQPLTSEIQTAPAQQDASPFGAPPAEEATQP